MLKHTFVAAAAAVLFVSNASAIDYPLSNVRLDSVAVIGVGVAGHKAGNVEVAITGGFLLLPGLRCSDTYWVTTLSTSDPDGKMLALLSAARTSGGTVNITLTDEPTLQAFTNRCSIKAVSR